MAIRVISRLHSEWRGENHPLVKCLDWIASDVEVFMRWTASVFLVVLLFFALPTYPQLGAPLGRCGPSPRDPSWPPNQLPSEQVSLEAQKRPTLDMLGLQRDAQELAEVSASIPADVKRVNRGLLPKDLMEKLKRVEKLSKHMRSELTR